MKLPGHQYQNNSSQITWIRMPMLWMQIDILMEDLHFAGARRASITWCGAKNQSITICEADGQRTFKGRKTYLNPSAYRMKSVTKHKSQNLKITFDNTCFEYLGWMLVAFSVLNPLTKIAIISYHVISRHIRILRAGNFNHLMRGKRSGEIVN